MLSEHFEKITFLGGEPTLAPYLPKMLAIAKERGRTTSIITNGYRLSEKYLHKLRGLLDWVTVSIDSSHPHIHAQLGRGFDGGKRPLAREHYEQVSEREYLLRRRLP